VLSQAVFTWPEYKAWWRPIIHPMLRHVETQLPGWSTLDEEYSAPVYVVPIAFRNRE
jgi:hypothetical protein